MSIFGNHIKVSLFGESHGPYIGITITGLASGIEIDEEHIKTRLNQRKPQEKFETPRIEQDDFQIISGHFEEKTTGAPLTVLLTNTQKNSNDYQHLQHKMRPSHSDLGAYLRYGHYDYRGGGHFSARLTAALVILGAICEQVLQKYNVKVLSHIHKILDLKDDSLNPLFYEANYQSLLTSSFAVINPEVKQEMLEKIKEIKAANDSIGGQIESVIYNVPKGIGSPYFNSLESIISHLLFSIGGLKGISFGSGFEGTSLLGSQANDAYTYQENQIITKTNHNGGIVGGISIGMPICIQTAWKAPSSIPIEQDTIDLSTKQNTKLIVKGRHDACYLGRAIVVINSLLYYAIAEAMSEKEGTSWMK